MLTDMHFNLGKKLNFGGITQVESICETETPRKVIWKPTRSSNFTCIFHTAFMFYEHILCNLSLRHTGRRLRCDHGGLGESARLPCGRRISEKRCSVWLGRPVSAATSLRLFWACSKLGGDLGDLGDLTAICSAVTALCGISQRPSGDQRPSGRFCRSQRGRRPVWLGYYRMLWFQIFRKPYDIDVVCQLKYRRTGVCQCPLPSGVLHQVVWSRQE